MKGEARRISKFATFVRDGSHSTRTTVLCENSGVSEYTCKGTVARWAAAIQRGRVASANMCPTGLPRTVCTDVARAVIAQCLEDERRWSLQELQAHSGIDQATVYKFLREDLHMRKIAAKWVPHALTEQ